MSISKIEDVLQRNTISLLKRILAIDCEVNDICTYIMQRYFTENVIYSKTLIGRIVSMGISPLTVLCHNGQSSHDLPADGHIESLKFLIHNENYIKPWSMEYKLVQLLTKSF